jgi:hypothetical protein
MLFATLIANLHDRLERRRRFRALVAEIESLSSRDLADIRGDRTDMLRDAHRQIYG